mgnify:CR=1 FL=1
MSIILVADDNLRLRQEISGILDQAGCDTVVVSDGQGAVEAVRRQAFDLIFLDVAMPGLNGLEALRMMRRIHPQVKVCMLTTLESYDLLVEATRDAEVDFVSKPVQARDLLQMVQKWCATSSGPVPVFC